METTTALALVPALIKEMEQEAATTRKMIARIPPEKFDWRPHPKSMSLKMLATHIAELPGWVAMALKTDGLDFAVTPYTPKDVSSTGELLDFFEEELSKGLAALATAHESTLNDDWIMRNGNVVLQHYSRYSVIRMSYSQIVHHRAQLGVYLRLLDIPLPKSYGSSADER